MKRIFGKLLLCFVVAMAMMDSGTLAQEVRTDSYKTPVYPFSNCGLAAEGDQVTVVGADTCMVAATKEAALAAISTIIGQIQRGENGDWIELSGRKWMLLKNNGNPLSLVSCGEKGMASLDCRCLQDMEDWLMGKTPEERVAGEEEIFVFLEVEPMLGGTKDGWKNYMLSNVRLQADVGGKVFVEIIIEKDGSISYVKVLRGFNCAANFEAMRVVAAAPKWSPAKHNGKPVRCQYVVSVNF